MLEDNGGVGVGVLITCLLTSTFIFIICCLQEGVPEAGSDREVEFLKHKQVLVDIVRRILQKRGEGEGLEELPFIDSMLQNYDSEDKVIGT